MYIQFSITSDGEKRCASLLCLVCIILLSLSHCACKVVWRSYWIPECCLYWLSFGRQAHHLEQPPSSFTLIWTDFVIQSHGLWIKYANKTNLQDEKMYKESELVLMTKKSVHFFISRSLVWKLHIGFELIYFTPSCGWQSLYTSPLQVSPLHWASVCPHSSHKTVGSRCRRPACSSFSYMCPVLNYWSP